MGAKRVRKPAELPDESYDKIQLTMLKAAAVKIAANNVTRSEQLSQLAGLGYEIKPPGGPTITETLEPVEPRYVPPPCPVCGAKMIVTSTPKRMRWLKCTNEDCGQIFKATQCQGTAI